MKFNSKIYDKEYSWSRTKSSRQPSFIQTCLRQQGGEMYRWNFLNTIPNLQIPEKMVLLPTQKLESKVPNSPELKKRVIPKTESTQPKRNKIRNKGLHSTKSTVK